MIAFLEGIVAQVREGSVVVQCGPVGVELLAPKPTLVSLSPGESVHLHTHLAVKEDSLSLYAFHETDLLELFRHLITVGGIGPKLALAILSALPTTALASAIREGDAALLASAPGVGKRTAERIVLELGSKIPESLAAPAGGPRKEGWALPEAGRDAIDALLALGYRESQVKQVVAQYALDNPDESAEALIRKALGKLR